MAGRQLVYNSAFPQQAFAYLLMTPLTLATVVFMSRCMLTLLCLSLVHFTHFTTVSADTPDNVGGVEIELIEPGAEPRSEIRFSPQPGAKQSSVMIMKMKQTMTMAGNKMPAQNIPTQRIVMEIEVNDVSPVGDITYAYEYTDFDVVDDPNQPSPLAPTLRATLKPMIGTTGSGIITNRGFSKMNQVNVPDGVAAPIKQMLDGMQESLNQLSLPLPAEPVGLGAKWRVIQNLNINGMNLTQTYINEITRVDREGFDYRVTVSQEAKPQEVKNPMFPPGTTIMLDSLTSDGQGTSTVAVNSIFPRKSKVAIHTVADMNVAVAGQNQKISTDMTMEMSLADAEE
jgi:hypothetical protein